MQGQGWTAAGELQPGNLVSTATGEWLPVQSITDPHQSVTVYNFRVSEYHTYFIAPGDLAFDVWVHNACGARKQLMGRTPDKWNSKTGRIVRERMQAEGNLVTTKEGTFVRFLDSDSSQYRWTKIDNTDMAHRIDAVAWWNDVAVPMGYAPRGPEVRKFMLDPNNYELQPYWMNRSSGAALKQKYNTSY